MNAAHDLGDLVLDGELVALRQGQLDFPALTTGRSRPDVRIHLLAFDLFAAGQQDLRPLPYQQRRARLEKVLATVAPGAPIQLVPMTTDRTAALSWFQSMFTRQGIEGVVAKPLHAPYRGRRGPWVKIRRLVVLDADVIGVTGTPTRPDALVLAVPDARGTPRAIGVSTAISGIIRAAIADRVHPVGEPQQLAGVVGGLPGQPPTTYQPVAPTVSVKIEADACVEFGRLRHRPRVVAANEMFDSTQH